MIKQVLNIVPHGLIQDGIVTFLIDENTGLIEVTSDIEAGVSIFSEHFTDDEKVKLDPTELLSAGIVDGLKVAIGPASLEFGSVTAGKSALAKVSVQGDDIGLKGFVLVDLGGKYISVGRLRVSGKIKGYDVDLELVT